jgi:hypothetical protein
VKLLAIVWLVIALTLAALVILIAPLLPAIPEEEDEHGR